MNAIGSFEAKTKFSEICDKVSKSSRPVVITRRGTPWVVITPFMPSGGEFKSVWQARKAFEQKNGSLDAHLPMPSRINKKIPILD